MRQPADDTPLMRANQIRAALYFVFAAVLCVLVLTGMLLRGRDAIAALSWGWEDIVTPITSDLKRGQQVNYGVYDFRQQFSEAKGVAIEHIFVSWLSSESDNVISSAFDYAKARNRWLMITVEPFVAEGRNRSQLLDDVIANGYDPYIASICGSIGSLQFPVFVRWGHEMESGDARYPWSGADGDRYIAAYRQFAVKCREIAPKTLLVWSPRGDPGLAEYYPGRAYVDLVGLSLYGLPAYELDHFGKVMNFREAFTPKYNRIIAFDKSVIIAEMGVSGGPKHQVRWMADFFRAARTFPLLRTAVYFNAKDSPGAWPDKYGIPDWRIDPNIFE